MDFKHLPFWIQVHDMPLLCMSKVVGTKIGNTLGVLEDVDVSGDGAGWGRSLELRVDIHLSCPLERGRTLLLGGKSIWVVFKYEQLSLLFFHFGRIIHEVNGCPENKGRRMNLEEGEKQWRVWLRAEETRK